MPHGWPANVARAAAGLIGTEARRPVALVVVPDGWGRTQTLDAAVALLDDRKIRSVRVVGRRAEREAPFGALAGLLDETASVDPVALRAARERLEAALGPDAVLVVDDAHWLDEASLRLITALVEAAPSTGAGVIVGHRPVSGGELDALDAQLARVGAVVRLEPCDENDVASRLAGPFGAEPDVAVTSLLLERTAGHARLVDRVAAAWVAAGCIEGGAFVTEPELTPSGIIDAIGATDLSPPAREVLVALALGATGDDEVVAGLVGVDRSKVRELVAELRAAGLLVPGHDEPLPVVADAVTTGNDGAAIRDVHQRLADLLAGRGAPATRVAEHLVAAGTRSPEAADVLVAAGRALLTEAPGHSVQLFDDAVDAGADADALLGLRAEASALSGDEERALVFAHADGTAPDSIARAVVVLGGLLARRGLWGRAEHAYRSVRDHPTLPRDAVAALAAVASVAGGQTPDDLGADPPPANLTADVARLLGRSALAAGHGDADDAVQAATEAAELVTVTGTSLVLPETPHALGAIVALATGDVDDAARLLALGLEVAAGGPAAAPRHHLLGGLTALRAGHWEQATAALDAAGDPATTRDAFFAAALHVGLARRLGDVGGLSDAWDSLSGPLAAVRSDLFLLLPLTEVVVAAGRLGHRDQTRARERELTAVLDGLGAPALWTRPFAWARVEAAVAAGDLEGLESAITDLASTSSAHERLDGLDAAAAAWRTVLVGEHERADVLEDGVAALERAGLVWEASRLLGQAAIRTGNPRDTRALLGRARELRGALPVVDELGGQVGTVLSAREQEVAAGVLDGLTHKEIGALLFISPKTVEHHVARIRQKLGASTRAEMLAGLRTTLAAS